MRVSLEQLIEIFGEPAQRSVVLYWWELGQVRFCYVRNRRPWMADAIKELSWVQTRGTLAIKNLTFEEALELLPREIREKALFHLDVFLEPITSQEGDVL